MRISPSQALTALVLVKLIGTLFACTVFRQITTAGDADRYISAQYSGFGSVHRTAIADAIFSGLYSIFRSDVLVSIVVSLLCALAIWYCIRPYYRAIDVWFVFITFLSPHFLIWSGFIGKEVISLIAFFVCISYCLRVIDGKRPQFVLHVPFFVLAAVMRPHYFAALLWFTFASITLGSQFFRRVRAGVVGLLGVIAVSAAVPLTFYIRYDWSMTIIDTMRTVQDYFILYPTARANRYFFQWTGIGDFIINMWWGIPFSLIGPLPSEVWSRPEFLPVFIEGIANVALLIYLMWKLYHHSREDVVLHNVFLYGLLPAVGIALIAHYPFGIFNPGSAMRYKQNLVPLLYFVPAIMLVLCRERLNMQSRYTGRVRRTPAPYHVNASAEPGAHRVRRIC